MPVTSSRPGGPVQEPQRSKAQQPQQAQQATAGESQATAQEGRTASQTTQATTPEPQAVEEPAPSAQDAPAPARDAASATQEAVTAEPSPEPSVPEQPGSSTAEGPAQSPQQQTAEPGAVSGSASGAEPVTPVDDGADGQPSAPGAQQPAAEPAGQPSQPEGGKQAAEAPAAGAQGEEAAVAEQQPEAGQSGATEQQPEAGQQPTPEQQPVAEQQSATGQQEGQLPVQQDGQVPGQVPAQQDGQSPTPSGGQPSPQPGEQSVGQPQEAQQAGSESASEQGGPASGATAQPAASEGPTPADAADTTVDPTAAEAAVPPAVPPAEETSLPGPQLAELPPQRDAGTDASDGGSGTAETVTPEQNAEQPGPAAQSGADEQQETAAPAGNPPGPGGDTVPAPRQETVPGPQSETLPTVPPQAGEPQPPTAPSIPAPSAPPINQGAHEAPAPTSEGEAGASNRAAHSPQPTGPGTGPQQDADGRAEDATQQPDGVAADAPATESGEPTPAHGTAVDTVAAPLDVTGESAAPHQEAAPGAAPEHAEPAGSTGSTAEPAGTPRSAEPAADEASSTGTEPTSGTGDAPAAEPAEAPTDGAAEPGKGEAAQAPEAAQQATAEAESAAGAAEDAEASEDHGVTDAPAQAGTAEATATPEPTVDGKPTTAEAGTTGTDATETDASGTAAATAATAAAETEATETATTETEKAVTAATEAETAGSGATESGATEAGTPESGATEAGATEAGTTEGGPAGAETRSAEAGTDPAEGESADGETAAGPVGEPAPGFAEAEREAVHRLMRERRDIRNGFRPDPVPHEVLLRVLEAAHTAPSVGHSQPWDFVVIRSAETRRTMHEMAQRQREAYAKSLPKGRAKQFKEMKIEAILDTPVNIVVTADPTRGGRHTLGRQTQPQMAPYSSALAVENLWLAARAEGLGVGWVSFFDEREMVRALGLPEHLEIVAYLCVGYVDEFPKEPELMQAGWSKRRPLSWVVHEESYGRRALPGAEPHDLLGETLSAIRPLDAKALGEAWERQKRMTKPSGALGCLEIISAQLCGLSRKCPPPVPEPAAVAVFAGDHGVHAQGVTPWAQEVTAQMVANFLGGGAVCNAFATQVGAEVCVVDVGVAGELPSSPGLLPRKVRPGTDDMTAGPALSREDAVRAIEVGIETARDLVAAGNKALLTGEMGIANTTASAALVAACTGVDPAEVTGRGTGINDETHARKVDVVRRALELHRPDPADAIGLLSAFGGLEHAAMVGLILGGASLRTPVILDGVSAGAAALVARALAPESLAACIAGHRSAEPGHVAALTKLGLRPLVDLDLRLGEGTGALLALPMVQSAARAMHDVATFDSAGVTEKG
ncbi:nicotinate-nucleotide--dimethylbenzimidazole phosphoribosyltransferase [Streptomyces cacaoi]|uniref:nicotinate-nucleotide--dimethylbenzimidazole phosphoribosyltransferase n=1 Tax=Streptomyces cacaoi TaxID=1898 RepID=UPI001479817D|nr:nicotinate-nucleotide--dimethylbenzimidazole phosphoribosyltransferase [Streptomyces cacaoi]